jgi:Arc/MetJ-type ribon-helix-helix transcriptional regulator
MNSNYSKTITLTMPAGLLVQVDQLAKLKYATRSEVLRQAILAYIHDSDLQIANIQSQQALGKPKKQLPKTEPEPERDYDQIVRKLADKHPQAALYDETLLAFLDDYEQDRS